MQATRILLCFIIPLVSYGKTPFKTGDDLIYIKPKIAFPIVYKFLKETDYGYVKIQACPKCRIDEVQGSLLKKITFLDDNQAMGLGFKRGGLVFFKRTHGFDWELHRVKRVASDGRIQLCDKEAMFKMAKEICLLYDLERFEKVRTIETVDSYPVAHTLLEPGQLVYQFLGVNKEVISGKYIQIITGEGELLLTLRYFESIDLYRESYFAFLDSDLTPIDTGKLFFSVDPHVDQKVGVQINHQFKLRTGSTVVFDHMGKKQRGEVDQILQNGYFSVTHSFFIRYHSPDMILEVEEF